MIKGQFQKLALNVSIPYCQTCPIAHQFAGRDTSKNRTSYYKFAYRKAIDENPARKARQIVRAAPIKLDHRSL